MKRRHALQMALAAAYGGFAPSGARAESYPTRPVRIVVPFAAGGTSDLVTRVLADELSKAWNQPVVADNRPGAGGNVGSEIVARATPDGYTLLMGTVATHGINASLYARLPFDPVRDFSPISLVASTPSVVMVNPAVPVRSIQELIAYAKAHPGELHFGSSGNGSSHHLAGELFAHMAGVRMVHVPYRGTAAAMTDTLSGQIQLIFDTLPSAMPHVRAGGLRVLAVTSPQRVPALPDVPTVAEAGLPGYEVGSWYALFAPANTPPAIVQQIGTAVAALVRRPDVNEKLMAQGAAPVGSSPAELAAHVASELAKWAPIVRASGARID